MVVNKGSINAVGVSSSWLCTLWVTILKGDPLIEPIVRHALLEATWVCLIQSYGNGCVSASSCMLMQV